MVLEVCVDSILSAVNASEAGADRVELCSALSEGGLTPSLGLFQGVRKALANSRTKIFCMIRIRRGDFTYSDEEIEAMVEDVKYFKSNGADGIVFGSLDEENKIDLIKSRKILSAWGSATSATFHRAFDETAMKDIEKNIASLASIGFDRILSSGLEPSAELGTSTLRRMIEHAGKSKTLKIMPGAGITAENIAKIISNTGCSEFHASARSPLQTRSVGKIPMGAGVTEEPLLVCNQEKVRELIQISSALLSSP